MFYRDCHRLNKLSFSSPQHTVAEAAIYSHHLKKTKGKSANFLNILVLTTQHLPQKSSWRGSEPGKSQCGSRRGAQQDLKKKKSTPKKTQYHQTQWQQETWGIKILLWSCCLAAFLDISFSCAFKHCPFP